MSENKKQTRPAFHGSDIEQIEKYYGIPGEQIVKFGANVNPLGLSGSVKRPWPITWILLPVILTGIIRICGE